VRTDGRLPDEVRPITIQRGYTRYAAGSVLIETGETKVICTAMVQNRVPQHCLAENKGWVTAEYCMLPSASPDRRSVRGFAPGRAQEIQRLIGRSLRSAVDLHGLAGRTIWVDCNVVQADGGTRTASVTGGFVAVLDALWQLREEGKLDCVPLLNSVAAVSVGIVSGKAMVDLCAQEDQAASVDMNVVMTHDGRFVEVQGTAERQPFTLEQQDEMMQLAARATEQVARAQVRVLAGRLEQ
jgi:ribonuclease PH